MTEAVAMTPHERAETIVFQLDQYLGALLNGSPTMKTSRGFLVLALSMALEEAASVPTLSGGDKQGGKDQ